MSKERSDYKEVVPGLYEEVSREASRVRLTREFVAALERHSGSKVLSRVLLAAIQKEEQRKPVPA